MSDLIKVKVLKYLRKDHAYCCECGRADDQFVRGITKWDEISREDYCELRGAVDEANQNKRDIYKYLLIQEQMIGDYQEIFDSAVEYVKYQTEQTRIREEQYAAEREKRAHKKLERKRKQLEKLKKELEKDS